MTAPPTEPGDAFLLFRHLPYEFDEDLPLAVGPNVYLDKTPHNVLDAAHPPSSVHLVLPGYHLPGLVSNCCLRSPATEVRPSGLEPSVLFFVSVAALRLRAPIAIKIAGQFELGQEYQLIKNPTLYHLTSAWQPDAGAFYSAEDVRFSAEIAQRGLELAQPNYKRFMSATVLFSQVTCGFSWSFQMAYLTLFSALEALFVPKGNKARTLAHRAAQFLSLPESLRDWLEKEYKFGRNKLAHGVQDVLPWTSLRPDKLKALGRLHEITRLSILGFMSLENDKLGSLSQESGTQLQTELDALPPAIGRFMMGQRMWCD